MRTLVRNMKACELGMSGHVVASSTELRVLKTLMDDSGCDINVELVETQVASDTYNRT
jgi:hypothetical protein